MPPLFPPPLFSFPPNSPSLKKKRQRVPEKALRERDYNAENVGLILAEMIKGGKERLKNRVQLATAPKSVTTLVVSARGIRGRRHL